MSSSPNRRLAESDGALALLRSAYLGVLCVGLHVACFSGPGREEEPEYVDTSYALNGSTGAATKLRLTDVTLSAGIDFVHQTGAFGEKRMPETMGSGGGFLDFDGDGWLDILLVSGSEWPGHATSGVRAMSRLYRNLGNGRFADVTEDAGLAFSSYGMGVSFADYDDDGDTDIYLTAVGPNRLLRNDAGKFTDVTQYAGVSGNTAASAESPSWSTAAAWLDYDGDGWIDLFVCNYVRWTPATDLFTTLDGRNKSYATPEHYDGDSCILYRNLDGQRFADKTVAAGLDNPNGKSLGVAVDDINGDGWVDLVVANDTERNFLYLNNRDGTFRDAAIEAGIGYDEFGRARAGMGVDVADVLGGGALSIVIGNFSQEPLSLYTEVGNGLFQDLAGRARLTRESMLKLTFGLVFVDLDLDGWLDLVTANGHIEPEINGVQQNVTFAQSPQVFLNDGQARFNDVTDQLGPDFARPIVARGVAFGDFDRDGDLDLLMTVNGESAKLFRNDLPPDSVNSIAIEIRGMSPNRDALGTVVTVHSGELAQRRVVRTGSSYLSQSDTRTLVFGLGKLRLVDSIRVSWPADGGKLTLGTASPGERYFIDQNTGTMTKLGGKR